MDEPTSDHTHTPITRHNARLGMVIFIFYVALYAGFVGLTAYDYRIMATIVFAGLNLAIVYGMGLILAAVVLAFVYMFFAKID